MTPPGTPDRVVQVGTQRRSSRLYAELAEVVRSGAMGKVDGARAYLTCNMSPPGWASRPTQPRRPSLDWDMWLGPRPERPFNPNILPYKFRWWRPVLIADGELGRALHRLAPLADGRDGSGLALGPRRPCSRSRTTGTIPDTAEVIFEHASGMLMIFGTYEASGHPGLSGGEIELRGTLATVYGDIGRFEVVPGTRGPVPGPEAALQARVRAEKEGYRCSTGPRPQLPRLRQIAAAAPRRHRGRPSLDELRPARQHRAGNPRTASTGTPRPSGSPTTNRPTSCSTTSTASRGHTGRDVLEREVLKHQSSVASQTSASWSCTPFGSWPR